MANEQPISASKRRPHVAALVIVLLLAAAAETARRYWQQSEPGEQRAQAEIQIPHVDLRGRDPAVVAAITSAQESVQTSPASAEAWGQLGIVLAVHDDRAAAMDCFHRASELDSLEPCWPYYSAVFGLDGDQAARIENLKRASELAPQAAHVRAALAEALLDAARPELAQREFERLLEQNPRDARAHLGLARIAAADDPTAARAHLKFCQDDEHARRASLVSLTQLDQAAGDRAAVEADMLRLANVPRDRLWPDPDLKATLRAKAGMEAQLELAGQYYIEGRGAEAISLARRTVAEYPRAAAPRVVLGRALIRNGNLAEAEAAFAAAAEREPKSFDAHFYLGVVAYQQQDYTAARDEFQQAAALKPDSSAYYNLGQSLVRLGEAQAAVAALRQAIRLKPGYAAAHFDLATILADQGRTSEALEQARAAQAALPSEPRLRELVKRLEGKAQAEP